MDEKSDENGVSGAVGAIRLRLVRVERMWPHKRKMRASAIPEQKATCHSPAMVALSMIGRLVRRVLVACCLEERSGLDPLSRTVGIGG